MHRIVKVEVPGRRNQLRVLDDMLQLACLVVNDHDGRLVLRAAPYREPDFVARLVVFRLNNALGTLADACPFGDRQYGHARVEVVDVKHANRLEGCCVRVERCIDPQVIGLRMGFDEQRTGTMTLDHSYHLPRMLLMLGRVGTDYSDGIRTQVAGRPDRAEFRIDEVCATSRMGNLVYVNHSSQLAGLEVDDRDLVGGVGGIHEVAVIGSQAAIMQEAWRVDRCGLQVVQIGVIDHQHLAGFLDVDHEFRLVVGRHDGRNARFADELAGFGSDAASRNYLQRLQRVAFMDHVLRRPVSAGDRVLVFVALELRGFDRARFGAGLHFGHDVGHLRPQVDQSELGVAAGHVQITAGCGVARDMHCVASVERGDDFFVIAVDQSYFAVIAQRGGEDVVQIDVVHLLRWAIFHRNQNLPCGFDIGQTHFWRSYRRLLHVTRHQIDFFFGQLATGLKTWHTARRTVTDKCLQVIRAFGNGKVRRQRFAGRTLTQHTMTTSATLEKDLASLVHFICTHWRSIDMITISTANSQRQSGQTCQYRQRLFVALVHNNYSPRMLRLLNYSPLPTPMPHEQKSHENVFDQTVAPNCTTQLRLCRGALPMYHCQCAAA